MRREAIMILPAHTDREKVALGLIIRWYLHAFPKTHPQLGHLGMYRILLETLHWRLSHFVLRRTQERQGFTLVLHEVFLLDFVLTLFLATMRTKGRRQHALLSVKQLREQLRRLAWLNTPQRKERFYAPTHPDHR